MSEDFDKVNIILSLGNRHFESVEDGDNVHGVHLFRLNVDKGNKDDDDDDGNDEFISIVVVIVFVDVAIDDDKTGVIQCSLIVPHVIGSNFCKRISTVFLRIFNEHLSGTISCLKKTKLKKKFNVNQ